MTLLTIIKYPDPLLRQKAHAIKVFDNELKTFAHDLYETMLAAPGVGITACHVGVLKQLTVIDLEKGKPQFFANPQILWQSDELSEANEGSVSMPGAIDVVKRPARVRVAYQDLSSVSLEIEADGFLAACLQHEIDQLDGIFWLERLSRLKRDRLIKRWQKTQR